MAQSVFRRAANERLVVHFYDPANVTHRRAFHPLVELHEGFGLRVTRVRSLSGHEYGRRLWWWRVLESEFREMGLVETRLYVPTFLDTRGRSMRYWKNKIVDVKYTIGDVQGGMTVRLDGSCREGAWLKTATVLTNIFVDAVERRRTARFCRRPTLLPPGVQEKTTNKRECCVCLDMKEVYILGCRHLLCPDCYASWRDSQAQLREEDGYPRAGFTCPFCRQ